MIKFFIIFILSFSFVWASSELEVSELIERTQKLSILKKLDVFSKHFIGHPYSSIGPLGEGITGEFDDSPLYRFDTFDCTTYIETIISLSLARDMDDFKEKINLIRYHNGNIDYFSRNHFTALEWIPHNVQNGILNEINDQITTEENLHIAHAIVDYPNWLRMAKIERIKQSKLSPEDRLERLKLLQDSSRYFSSQLESISYIEISYLLDHPEILEKLPNFSVVNFIRPNWDLTSSIGTHMNVSHQGLLIRNSLDTIVLRHASSSGELKVTEIDFIKYLEKFRNHPTLKGVHFMQINHSK